VHWPPFLKAAVEHIRETYPDPKTNEQAQSLVAFIFAVSGHQVQDAAWHSIGLLMGFMDEVAKVDRHGDFSSAHEILDWGGDAILAKRFSAHKGSADWAFVYPGGEVADDRESGTSRWMILPRYITVWGSR
jgi:Zinc dependent phospholipase C